VLCRRFWLHGARSDRPARRARDRTVRIRPTDDTASKFPLWSRSPPVRRHAPVSGADGKGSAAPLSIPRSRGSRDLRQLIHALSSYLSRCATNSWNAWHGDAVSCTDARRELRMTSRITRRRGAVGSTHPTARQRPHRESSVSGHSRPGKAGSAGGFADPGAAATRCCGQPPHIAGAAGVRRAAPWAQDDLPACRSRATSSARAR